MGSWVHTRGWLLLMGNRGRGTESVKFEISGFWANLGRLTSLNLFPWLLKWRQCSYLTGSFQGLNEIKFVNDSKVFLVSLDLLPSKFNQFNQLMWSRWQRSGPQQTLKERQWEKERQGKDENKFIFAKLFSSNSLQITYQRIFNKVLVELSEVAIKQALLTRYWLPERNAVSSVLFPDARRQAEGNKSEKKELRKSHQWWLWTPLTCYILLWKSSNFLYIVMCHLTMGIHYEKWVVSWFPHCVNFIECTSRQSSLLHT